MPLFPRTVSFYRSQTPNAPQNHHPQHLPRHGQSDQDHLSRAQLPRHGRPRGTRLPAPTTARSAQTSSAPPSSHPARQAHSQTRSSSAGFIPKHELKLLSLSQIAPLPTHEPSSTPASPTPTVAPPPSFILPTNPHYSQRPLYSYSSPSSCFVFRHYAYAYCIFFTGFF